LVPLFWIVPGPVTLLVVQAIAFALGAPAVYLLARRRLEDDGLAALFALLYLLNPSLQGMNVRDFHPAVLVVPLLLWAFVAAEAGRALACAGLLVLTPASREDGAPAVVRGGVLLLAPRGLGSPPAVRACGPPLVCPPQWPRQSRTRTCAGTRPSGGRCSTSCS